MILPEGTSPESLGLTPDQVWPVPATVASITLISPMQHTTIPFSDAEREELARDGLVVKWMMSDPWQAVKAAVPLFFYVPR